jgi:putative NADH-flavin reductase
MHFLILGASGRSGLLTVDEALSRGHTVTALVRKVSSIEARKGLHIIEGTPLNQQDIEKCFATSEPTIDAVIVTLNATRASDSPFAKPTSPAHLIRDSVRNLTAVMEKHGVKRLIMMSSFGIGSSWSQLSWLIKPMFSYTNMKYAISDHHDVDADLHANDRVDWTLVRPVMLTDADAAEIKEFGEFGKGNAMTSSISRASVAKFLIRVGEEEGWSRKAIVISN